VAESFRFDFREAGDRAARFITFEKSSAIPDQAIEVDPTRGVFLLGRADGAEEANLGQGAPQPPSSAELESIREELRAARSRTSTERSGPIAEIDLTVEAPIEIDLTLDSDDTAQLAPDQEARDIRKTRKLTSVEEEFQAPRARQR
jgi:hypothetical protein